MPFIPNNDYRIYLKARRESSTILTQLAHRLKNLDASSETPKYERLTESRSVNARFRDVVYAFWVLATKTTAFDVENDTCVGHRQHALVPRPQDISHVIEDLKEFGRPKMLSTNSQDPSGDITEAIHISKYEHCVVSYLLACKRHAAQRIADKLPSGLPLAAEQLIGQYLDEHGPLSIQESFLNYMRKRKRHGRNRDPFREQMKDMLAERHNEPVEVKCRHLDNARLPPKDSGLTNDNWKRFSSWAMLCRSLKGKDRVHLQNYLAQISRDGFREKTRKRPRPK